MRLRELESFFFVQARWGSGQGSRIIRPSSLTPTLNPPACLDVSTFSSSDVRDDARGGRTRTTTTYLPHQKASVHDVLQTQHTIKSKAVEVKAAEPKDSVVLGGNGRGGGGGGGRHASHVVPPVPHGAPFFMGMEPHTLGYDETGAVVGVAAGVTGVMPFANLTGSPAPAGLRGGRGGMMTMPPMYAPHPGMSIAGVGGAGYYAPAAAQYYAPVSMPMTMPLPMSGASVVSTVDPTGGMIAVGGVPAPMYWPPSTSTAVPVVVDPGTPQYPPGSPPAMMYSPVPVPVSSAARVACQSERQAVTVSGEKGG